MRGVRPSVTLTGLLQAAATLTVAFSIITAIGIPHWSVELFTHFRLQYLVVGALLLICFAALRRPAWSLALLVATVINAWHVVPWYVGQPPDTGGPHLKVAHANVHSGNDDYQRLIDWLLEEDPDIVFLQEVTSEWVAAAAVLKKDYPHALAEPRPGNFGIAVFSKVPFDAVRQLESPPFGYPTIVAQVSLDRQSLSLISTHPTIPVAGALYDARNRQLEYVAELVNNETNPVLLIGDLNASLWCPQYERFETETGLVNVRQGLGLLPTWPTFMPLAMIPIDHALVSEGIAVMDVHTGSRIGSDHLPLVVTISL